MAFSKRAKEDAWQELNSIFPEAKITLIKEDQEGGAEAIKVITQEIDRAEFQALAKFVNEVPNFFYIKRSAVGTGLTIIFS